MTDVQSWQVSVMIEPWGGKGAPSPQPRQAGLPGPSRGAALAVRPTPMGNKQPEEVPGEVALLLMGPHSRAQRLGSLLSRTR